MHIANVAIKGVSECERREAAAMGNGMLLYITEQVEELAWLIF